MMLCAAGNRDLVIPNSAQEQQRDATTKGIQWEPADPAAARQQNNVQARHLQQSSDGSFLTITNTMVRAKVLHWVSGCRCSASVWFSPEYLECTRASVSDCSPTLQVFNIPVGTSEQDVIAAIQSRIAAGKTSQMSMTFFIPASPSCTLYQHQKCQSTIDQSIGQPCDSIHNTCSTQYPQCTCACSVVECDVAINAVWIWMVSAQWSYGSIHDSIHYGSAHVTQPPFSTPSFTSEAT
jgi:hypothetical protein